MARKRKNNKRRNNPDDNTLMLLLLGGVALFALSKPATPVYTQPYTGYAPTTTATSMAINPATGLPYADGTNYLNPATGQPYINPATGQPYVNPQTGQPYGMQYGQQMPFQPYQPGGNITINPNINIGTGSGGGGGENW